MTRGVVAIVAMLVLAAAVGGCGATFDGYVRYGRQTSAALLPRGDRPIGTSPVPDAVVVLNGIDRDGHGISMRTVTDREGSFSFPLDRIDLGHRIEVVAQGRGTQRARWDGFVKDPEKLPSSLVLVVTPAGAGPSR